MDKDADNDKDEHTDSPKGDTNGDQDRRDKDHAGGDDDDDDNDGDGEEDDTAELLREPGKIKREGVAEKARVVQAEAAVTEAEREEQTATANHLFSLAAALGNAPGINTTVTAPGTFAVKRHWG